MILLHGVCLQSLRYFDNAISSPNINIEKPGIKECVISRPFRHRLPTMLVCNIAHSLCNETVGEVKRLYYVVRLVGDVLSRSLYEEAGSVIIFAGYF